MRFHNQTKKSDDMDRTPALSVQRHPPLPSRDTDVSVRGPPARRDRGDRPPPAPRRGGARVHDLAGCLVEQQHPQRSTKGTFRALLDRVGIERLTVADARRFEAKALPHVRLSAQKRQAWGAAVEAFAGSDSDWAAMPDDDVREALCAIRGVGPWTADVILLWTLGRHDVFPVDDYHLKKAMASRYGIAEGAGQRRAMREVADGWRPRRSLAVRHLLAWREWQAGAFR